MCLFIHVSFCELLVNNKYCSYQNHILAFTICFLCYTTLRFLYLFANLMKKKRKKKVNHAFTTNKTFLPLTKTFYSINLLIYLSLSFR